LLPPLPPSTKHPITLILDVDETLVHSSFKTTPKKCDIQLPITVNGQSGTVFVKVRPYLQEFFQFIAPRFEVVIFTASLALYCDPLMEILDPEYKLGRLRLFRDHCTKTNGAFVKDLSLLGRPLERVAIIDNSPVAYYFQPRNAIPIVSWFDDQNDHELLELLPLLGQLANCSNVYEFLDPFNASVMQQ
jgi:RNA polymerase II subunit A small phosphatase-like protein